MQVQLEEELNKDLKLDNVPPLEFIFQRISVDAKIQKEVPDGKGGFKKEKGVRRILKEASGRFSPNSMTAILGPSGSGKTTMLNLLSGRLLSKNLSVHGIIKVNGKQVPNLSEYKSLVGYVMQEDLMLPTFTPEETFRFITDMRLPHKTDEEKDALVNNMIESLGLVKCRDTYIGNYLIRGISGGEKKRTSVGIQLLINPSLLFLDEPTTGLDSTTSLNLIRFLNRLASCGRTIVTTIHQPSSEIFLEFDKILLLVDGNIVYHNDASASMAYFSRLGMSVPVHSNPMDHYMKLMNKQGITLKYIENGQEYEQSAVVREFQQKTNFLVRSYKQSKTEPTQSCTVEISDYQGQAKWCTQLCLITKRSIKNELRNPMGLRSKIGQSIFFAIMCIILYERQSTNLNNYLQNVAGCVFFIIMNVCFSAIFGSINVFNEERPVFIRERLSNTYHTSAYFVGRSLAYEPLEILLPFLMLVICYFAVHLDNDAQSFFICAGACWLGTWMSSAYGLLLSTAFKDAEVALSLVPILIIPLMLVGGLFAPLQSVPDFFKIFEYISMFKFGYQSFIQGQFIDDRDGFTFKGRDGTTETYPGDLLGKGSIFYFVDPLWLNLMLMAAIGLAIRVISLIALYLISNPKKLHLHAPVSDEQVEGANPDLMAVSQNRFREHGPEERTDQIKMEEHKKFNALK